MNWTRGLVRLWLVCTLGWLVFNVAIGWDGITSSVDGSSALASFRPTPPGFPPAYPRASDKPSSDQGSITLEEYRSHRNADAHSPAVRVEPPPWAKAFGINAPPENGSVSVDQVYSELDAEKKRAKEASATRPIIAERLAVTIGLAAIPSVIVLVFGALLVWAIRGFTRSPSAR